MSIVQNRLILLVDDDHITNMINEKLIARYHPFKVIAFTSAGDALVYLRKYVALDFQRMPEVILLDVNMPQMNGWKFLVEFEKLPDALINRCRLVVLSSSIDSDDIAKSQTFRSVKDFICQ